MRVSGKESDKGKQMTVQDLINRLLEYGPRKRIDFTHYGRPLEIKSVTGGSTGITWELGEPGRP